MVLQPSRNAPRYKCEDCGRFFGDPLLSRIFFPEKRRRSRTPPKCPGCGSRNVGVIFY